MPVTITIDNVNSSLHRKVITVEVHGIVRITEDGHTATDGLEDPNIKPWYVVSVDIESKYGNYGRSRWWATDGDEYIRLETQNGRYAGHTMSVLYNIKCNGPSALVVSYSIHPGLDVRGVVEFAIYIYEKERSDE